MAEPMVSDQSPQRSSGERMQRLRVGITGLAGVLIVVAVATAVVSNVRRSADESNAVAPPPVVATLPPAGNATEVVTEPLAQLGAAPGKAAPATPEAPKK